MDPVGDDRTRAARCDRRQYPHRSWRAGRHDRVDLRRSPSPVHHRDPRTRSHPGLSTGLVAMAPPPSTSRPHQPLPATAGHAVLSVTTYGWSTRHRQGRRGHRNWTASTYCASTTPPEQRGHRARLQAAAGGRTRLARLKQVLDLRPVFHRLEDRIRAHVLLCWLALLLIRVVEENH